MRDLARSSKSVHPIVRETWAAMEDIYGLGILETPLEPSAWLRSFTRGSDGSVHLKMENRQVTGSFKARGAAHKLFSLSESELGAGLVTSSTGNHALAMLHAASALAAAGRTIDLTVYIPATISAQKAAKLRSAAEKHGQKNVAKIVTVGTDCVEAELAARRFAASTGKNYVSPYNDYKVAGGQGTVGVELLMQISPGKLDVVFVPVGGGGLVAGVAAVLKSVDPHITVIGCQPEVSDVMRRSVAAGHVVELPWEESLSDGTAGGIEAGSVTLDACRTFVDEWITVSEQEIAAAMVGIHGHHGMEIEGSAAVAVAAFIKAAEKMSGKHAVILCCGGNVASETLDKAYEMTRQKGKGGAASRQRGPAAAF